MKHSLWRIPALTLTMLAIILAIAAPPANAHYIAVEADVWWTSQDTCVKGRAEVSHGANNAGYYKGDATSRRPAWNWMNSVPCGDVHFRPQGWIKIYQNVNRWDHYSQQWLVCLAQGWVYNANYTSKLVTYHNAGRMFCPPGYYANHVSSYVLNNGVWQGGAIWSGYHYLPA